MLRHQVTRGVAAFVVRGRPAFMMRVMLMVIGTALLAAPSAYAQCGAICLYEVGTPDQSLAGAGAGARAQDAGTVWFNPAGMTNLDGTEFMIGLTALYIGQSFQVGHGTQSPTNNETGGQAGIFAPGFAAYLVSDLAWAGKVGETEIGKNVRLGLAVNTPYGGGWNYNDDWVGREFVTELSAGILNIQPSLAYRVTDWLSLGGGLNVYYFEAKEEFKLGQGPLAPTGNADKVDDWLVAGTASIMLEPFEGTRIGVTYKSKLKVRATGDLDDLGENIRAEVDLPQGVNVALFHQLTPMVAILADVGWSDYSELKYERVKLQRVGGSLDRDWQDTWRLGAGVQLQVTEPTRLQFGISYDSNPVPASKRLPDLPIGDVLRFALGAGHDFNEHVNISTAYTLGWMRGNDVSNVELPDGVVLDGKYTTNLYHFFGLSLNVKL